MPIVNQAYFLSPYISIYKNAWVYAYFRYIFFAFYEQERLSFIFAYWYKLISSYLDEHVRFFCVTDLINILQSTSNLSETVGPPTDDSS